MPAPQLEMVDSIRSGLMDYVRSRLPSSTQLSAATMPDSAKRMLLQSTSRPESRSASRQSTRGDEREGRSQGALRFGGIWNKLERGVRQLTSWVDAYSACLQVEMTKD